MKTLSKLDIVEAFIAALITAGGAGGFALATETLPLYVSLPIVCSVVFSTYFLFLVYFSK